MNNLIRIVSISIIVITFSGCTSQADCKLDVAKNAKTEIAAKIGYEACEEKYGE